MTEIAAPLPEGLPTRRTVILGAALGAAAVASPLGNLVLPLGSSAVPTLDQMIPRQVGDWRSIGSRGVILPVDAQGAEPYDDQLERVYVSEADRPVMLVIAYCSRPQHGLIQIHDPRVCYPAAGFEIGPSRICPLNVGFPGVTLAKSFVARRKDRVEQVIYWTRVGDELMPGIGDQHLAIIRSVLHGTVPDGLIFRVSSLGAGEAAVRELERFTSELLMAASPTSRRFLLGAAAQATYVSV